MNNIFLVKSPLQLLNAIEARHHFGLDDRNCYLLVMGDRKSYSQLMQLVKISKQWANLVLINRVPLFGARPWSANINFDRLDREREALLRSSVFSIRRLNRLAASITDVDNVFLGDNNNAFMRHFSNTVRHQRTVLLDDGTATLDIARQRLQGEKLRKPNSRRKAIKLWARRRLQGLRDQQPAKVCFFSAYNITVEPPDQLVVNDFGYLRNRASSLESCNDIYFIGSPLSEVGLMTETSYLDQLAMVKAQFVDRDFVYIAHRRENADKLESIGKLPGFRVRLFEYPLEYQLAMLGPRPEVVISFITSALDNLSIILGDSIKIISYRLLPGSYRDRQRIDAIYDHYQSHNSDSFQCLKLQKG